MKTEGADDLEYILKAVIFSFISKNKEKFITGSLKASLFTPAG